MHQLFDPKDGCKLTVCRIPLGASDFSIEAYSLNEEAGDYEMEKFSIDRDRRYMIPYIRAAMEINPDLAVWASPWSPPAWLKTSCALNCGYLLPDPKSRTALALYFVKFVEEYQKEGIPLFAIMPQNEPCWDNLSYPACGYTAGQMKDFLKYYLLPLFSRRIRNCEIWLGTLVDEQYGIKLGMDIVDETLSDPAVAKYIHGIGCQYAKKDKMKAVHDQYPNIELMMTETNCGSHENDWPYAQSQFTDIVDYLNFGASSYMLWNMVLDETGTSFTGWAQCSPVTIDTRIGEAIYNPQFFAYKHFSHFVEPGARVLSTAVQGIEGAAFRNPDGRIILVAQNTKDATVTVDLRIDNFAMKCAMAPVSWNTVVLEENRN